MLSAMYFLIMAGVEMVNYSGKFAFKASQPAKDNSNILTWYGLFKTPSTSSIDVLVFYALF